MSRYGTLCRAELTLDYLHANSTTHDFLFGAVAELIDNSRDAGATRLDIFTVNNENLQGGFMLCFLDDGCGMTPREATDLVYFGRSSKRTVPNMIGRYGNGLKSGSMRIGKDFILFTKKETTMTCLLFSQTFCEKEGLTEVVVPIPSWSSNTKDPIFEDPEKFTTQLSIICKHSPFKTEAELMNQFDSIYAKTGTLVVIYNLKLMLNGEPELDIQTDTVDILIAGTPENLPEQQSLRAYTAIMYFEPQMRIFIQAERVETKRLPYCFYRPRMYPYTSSAIKEVVTKELEKAEMEVKSAEHAVKEARCTLAHLQDSHSHGDIKFAQVAVWNAMTNEKKRRENLEEKKRNLRKPKKLFLIFGINIQNRSQDGMLIYSNNRLIRVFEKVGPQKEIGSYLGAGAVGMVNVPVEVMELSHNKQTFASVRKYNHLLKTMESYLGQYWKDIGMSQKGETFFWNDFGYLSNNWCEKPCDTIKYKRRRAVEIPDIVQCDICLKWRILSLDTDTNKGEHHGIWNCANNPNILENKCSVPEHLPSIPLGTFIPPSQSEDNRQKLLMDSIQQHKRKVQNTPSQKPLLIQPHTMVQQITKHRAPAKNKNENVEKTVCQKKAFLRDPSPSCRNLVKSCTSKGSVQNLSHKNQQPAKQKAFSWRTMETCKEEKNSCSVLEDWNDHNISVVLPVEIQNEQPYTSELQVIKMETDSEPEVIWITSDSESEDLTKYDECKDFVFMQKGEEKQEQCDEKGNCSFSLIGYVDFEGKDLLLPDSESGFTEASKEENEKQVLVAIQSSEAAVSHTQETFQSTHESKMIEALTACVKEVLIYFLPECDLSREHLACMSPEDILSMFKLKEHFEQNKNIPVYMDQYFLKYEGQLAEKIRSINQHGLEAVGAIETEISLSEVRIKTAEEKLLRLREKVAQLLLKIHPHLIMNNLEDVDDYVDETLNQENLSTFVFENANSAELSKSTILDDGAEKAFDTI